MSAKAPLTLVEPVGVKKQPKSQTVTAGKNVSLRVTASGTPPFHYRWMWNGSFIPNATNSFLVIPKIQQANEGNYSVWVDHGLSWDWSDDAVITVNP